MVEQVPGQQEDDGHQPDGHRQAEQIAGPQPGEVIGAVAEAGGDGTSLGVDHGHAAQGRHGHQGGDEGLHLALGDDEAADAAEQGAGPQGEGHHQPDRQLHGHHGRRQGAAQGQHGADRQIDAGGEDDQRHADRHDGVDRGLAQYVEQVVGGEEVGAQEGDHADQHQQRHQGFVLDPPGLAHDATAGKGLGCHCAASCSACHCLPTAAAISFS